MTLPFTVQWSGIYQVASQHERLYRGQRFLCKAIASKVLLGFLSGDRQPTSPVPAGSITVREREVLVRIAQGQSNKVIARDLGLSPKTVEKHRANMMRKLQLHSAAAITMYAIRSGLDGGDRAGIFCHG
jgi:DNA-binding NarL/FixJ family response regulator